MLWIQVLSMKRLQGKYHKMEIFSVEYILYTVTAWSTANLGLSTSVHICHKLLRKTSVKCIVIQAIIP